MSFNQPITDLIRRRVSCRSYTKEPLRASDRQRLADFVAASPSGPFGSPVRIELVAATGQDNKALRGLGTYGFIKGATAFLIGAIGPGERNLEDLGYLMERIVLYATDLGLGTCWLGGSFTKSNFARRIAIREGERVPAVVAAGYPAPRRGTVDSMVRQIAHAHQRLPAEQLFFDRTFGVPLRLAETGDLALALEMVRLAPSASNKQPWRIIKEDQGWHFYLQRTKGYREGRIMRLLKIDDMQRIDMGIAMCHFALTAAELGLQGQWEQREPPLEKPDERTEYIISWVSSAQSTAAEPL